MEMNKRAKKICNDKDAEFMELGENDYYTLNIFKAGDHENNEKFYNKLKSFNSTIAKGV